MALLCRRNTFLGVICACLIVLGELYAFSLHFETRAIILRAHFVVLVQVFLLVVSMSLWNSLTKFDSEVLSSANPSFNDEHSTPASSTPNNHPVNSKWTLWKYLVLFYMILCHSAYLTNVFLIGNEPHWYSMLAYSCLGIYFQLATAIFSLRFTKWIVKLLFRWRTGRELKSKLYSKKLTAALAILYAVSAAFWGFHAAAQMPRLKTVKIPLKGLEDHYHGTSIIQLSDIHLGPTVGQAKLAQIAEVVNNNNPGENVFFTYIYSQQGILHNKYIFFFYSIVTIPISG